VEKFSIKFPLLADVAVTLFVLIITCPRTITVLDIITQKISRIISTVETAERNYLDCLSDVTDVGVFYVMIAAYRRIISVQIPHLIRHRSDPLL
jgi:hypothetical protein